MYFKKRCLWEQRRRQLERLGELSNYGGSLTTVEGERKGKKKKKESGIEASETAAHFFRVLEPNSLLEESPAYQERRVKGGTKVAAYVVDMFVVIVQLLSHV